MRATSGRPWRTTLQRWLGLLASLVLAVLAACGSPPPPATASRLPVLALPPSLAGYHIFASDLVTGDLAELGIATLHAARSTHGLGISTDGHTLYASDVAGNALLAYPILAGGRLGSQRRVQVGVYPVHMVQTLDGSAIFVTNFGGASVSVVDTATMHVTATIPVPARPHGIAIAPDGRWVYVACVEGGSVAVLDAATRVQVGTIALPVGAKPYAVAVSRDGRYLYVPDNFAARLFVIDIAARRVVGAVAIGLRAALVARSADGATLYVTNGASGTVSVLDLAANPIHPRLRATISVGAYPHGLALTPDGRYLVVANNLGKNLSVIETATDQVVATVPAEKYPNDVIVVP